MEKREKTAAAGAALTAVLVLAAGYYFMFWKGGMGERLLCRESLLLTAEILAFFLWNLWWLQKGRNLWEKAAASALSWVVFTWCHRIALPLFVSGLYAGYLILLGGFVLRLIGAGREGKDRDVISGLAVRFLWGSAVWITLVCLVSAFGYGGIRTWRLLAAATALPLYLEAGVRIRKRISARERKEVRLSGAAFFTSAALALIMAMAALQAGRLNIAVDYDSIHYGLRSPYILDNGRGIYENLGNINLVYTYSKGLEVLVLPLSGTATYGYVLSFNLWVTAGILALVYRTASYLLPEGPQKIRGAWAAAALTACIPGIMNMGITAKTDSITLFLQLLFINCLLEFQQPDSDRTRCFVTGSCACLLTYCMKPTSLVFTTAIYGMTLIWLAVRKQLKLTLRHRIWLCSFTCIAAWLGIWARTWKLTGYPVTSVFTSVWDLLGFRIRYPFAFQGIPDAGNGLGIGGQVLHLWDRLWKMMAAPVGEDMAHVVIAWGSALIPVLLAVCILYRKNKSAEGRYLSVLYLPLSVISLASVHLLWQVDGNYFMLFYALTAVLAVSAVYGQSREGLRRASEWIVAPVIFSAVVMTCITNWSGTLGLTPLRLVHSGYYNHQEENYRRLAEKGNEAIWNILASDPRNRVIAMGEHLEVVTFPCNVQSYYDVTGSGGNVWLVKKLDYFKEFLRYAQIDYLYVQADDTVDGQRARDIVTYMLEDGSLYDVRYEYGNLLARIDHEK